MSVPNDKCCQERLAFERRVLLELYERISVRYPVGTDAELAHMYMKTLQGLLDGLRGTGSEYAALREELGA